MTNNISLFFLKLFTTLMQVIGVTTNETLFVHFSNLSICFSVIVIFLKVCSELWLKVMWYNNM